MFAFKIVIAIFNQKNYKLIFLQNWAVLVETPKTVWVRNHAKNQKKGIIQNNLDYI